MSEAICGANAGGSPGCRFAHPGYGSATVPHANGSRSPKRNRRRRSQRVCSRGAVSMRANNKQQWEHRLRRQLHVRSADDSARTSNVSLGRPRSGRSWLLAPQAIAASPPSRPPSARLVVRSLTPRRQSVPARSALIRGPFVLIQSRQSCRPMRRPSSCFPSMHPAPAVAHNRGRRKRLRTTRVRPLSVRSARRDPTY